MTTSNLPLYLEPYAPQGAVVFRAVRSKVPLYFEAYAVVFGAVRRCILRRTYGPKYNGTVYLISDSNSDSTAHTRPTGEKWPQEQPLPRLPAPTGAATGMLGIAVAGILSAPSTAADRGEPQQRSPAGKLLRTPPPTPAPFSGPRRSTEAAHARN